VHKYFAILLLSTLGFAWADEEIAPYKVVQTDGAFEVRDYPALVLVETTAEEENDNGRFGRLFRYISGANVDTRKIPMTAPVFMDPRGTSGRMAFVMPAALALSDTPRANDDTLSIRQQPAGRFAVYRFSGVSSTTAERAALEKLNTWMSTAALEATGPAVFGYYDPPWTLPFLRRNEVIVPLSGTARAGASQPTR
jgi:DNA gyrase inhibitor GyrI